MSDSQPDLQQMLAMLGDPATRDSVPSKLHQHGEAAAEALVEALRNADENIRQGAAWAIGRVNNSVLGAAVKPLALEPLVGLLQNDESGRVRSQALATLNQLVTAAERQSLVEPLIAVLNDAQEGLRAEAARLLGQIADARALEPLRGLMENDPVEKVRGRAAYALAYIEPELDTLRAADKAGIDALSLAVKDTERSVRLRAIWALGHLKVTQAVRLLASVLDGEGNEPDKRRAAEALGQIGDGSAAESLIMALQFDTSEGVRSSAAEALGLLDDRRALNMLVRSLHSDASPSVRASAAKALEAMANPEAIEPLIEALNDESPDVRFRAAVALGVLADERAAAPLAALLDDPQSSKQIRMAVEQALAGIDGQREDA